MRERENCFFSLLAALSNENLHPLPYLPAYLPAPPPARLSVLTGVSRSPSARCSGFRSLRKFSGSTRFARTRVRNILSTASTLTRRCNSGYAECHGYAKHVTMVPTHVHNNGKRALVCAPLDGTLLAMESFPGKQRELNARGWYLVPSRNLSPAGPGTRGTYSPSRQRISVLRQPS